MLSLNSLTLRYGSLVALDRVSLQIERGEFFGLLGPNGAGKSSLMSIIAGLRAPDSGEARVHGSPIATRSPEVVGAIGFVPQSIALYEDLTALENLQIFGRLYGLGGKRLKDRIETCLDAVQLSDRRRHAVKTFSGGMQRRLNLAASLLHEPRLLLCDEPTVGVDPQSRNAIFDLLEQLNRDGMTIIYSTHYMEEATRLCSRIGIIDHGKILALGSLDELLGKLPTAEIVSFSRNGGTAATALRSFGELRDAADQYELHLRPEVTLAEVFAASRNAGLPDRAFTLKRPSLENVFLHLTGKTLRE